MKSGPNIVICGNSWLTTASREQTNVTDPTGAVKWVPARPIAYPTLVERIKRTWWVLTGKADALVWMEDIYNGEFK